MCVCVELALDHYRLYQSVIVGVELRHTEGGEQAEFTRVRQILVLVSKTFRDGGDVSVCILDFHTDGFMCPHLC